MLIKFIFIMAAGSWLCHTFTGRWPWAFLGNQSTRAQALFRARRLLGVRADAAHGDIIEAHRRLIAMVHPDRGGNSDQVHEANAARDLLLDELP